MAGRDLPPARPRTLPARDTRRGVDITPHPTGTNHHRNSPKGTAMGTREARREAQERKRTEAEARNAKSNARLRDCGHVHGDAQVWRCEKAAS